MRDLAVVRGVTEEDVLQRAEHVTPEAVSERARTVFGILVCGTTTILVFGVLAFSKIPVLHAIGLSAASGSFCCLLFAGLMGRGEPRVA